MLAGSRQQERKGQSTEETECLARRFPRAEQAVGLLLLLAMPELRGYSLSKIAEMIVANVGPRIQRLLLPVLGREGGGTSFMC